MDIPSSSSVAQVPPHISTVPDEETQSCAPELPSTTITVSVSGDPNFLPSPESTPVHSVPAAETAPVSVPPTIPSVMEPIQKHSSQQSQQQQPTIPVLLIT